MLGITVTEELINNFILLNGQEMYINIIHALYGPQKLRCVLQTFFDGERIGFIVDGNEKFVRMDELLDIVVSENECIIRSDVMEIYIKATNM